MTPPPPSPNCHQPVLIRAVTSVERNKNMANIFPVSNAIGNSDQENLITTTPCSGRSKSVSAGTNAVQIAGGSSNISGKLL